MTYFGEKFHNNKEQLRKKQERVAQFGLGLGLGLGVAQLQLLAWPLKRRSPTHFCKAKDGAGNWRR